MRMVLAVALIGLSTAAHAAPTCLLEVNGRRVLDGSCNATRFGNGKIVIGDPRGTGAFVRPDFADSDRATGAYKSDGGRTRGLGELSRDGMSCWRGRGVRLCAWGAQD